MLQRIQHIIILLLLLCSTTKATAQAAMPDYVCVGTTKKYSVNNAQVPSTYTWTINGAVQSTTANEMTVTWNTVGKFLVTVQEHSATGCDGEIQSGYVYVSAKSVSTTNIAICQDQLPYTWNGSTITGAGIYTANLTNTAGCDSIATLQLKINPLPTASISAGGDLCLGDSKTLTVSLTGIAPFTVVYTDGTNQIKVANITANAFQFTISPTINTTYAVISVADAFCSNKNINATAVINVLPVLSAVRYPTVIAAPNVPQQLTARSPGTGYSYSWSPSIGISNPSIINPVFKHNLQMEYKITLTSSAGCKVVDTLLVKLSATRPIVPTADIFVPNAWSPNGDGHNDKLIPLTFNIRELKYFRVFNRWGQIVYETNISSQGWDGIFKGKLQVADAYTWVAEAIGINGEVIRRSGNSVLIK